MFKPAVRLSPLFSLLVFFDTQLWKPTCCGLPSSSSSSLKGNRGILITVQRVIPTLLRGVECRAQRRRSRNGGNQRKRLAARLGEVESGNEREIHATSSSIRGLAREEKGASYALSASARPATGGGASREGSLGREGRATQRFGRARTRYHRRCCSSRRRARKRVSLMATAEKNKVSVQCCGGDSVEWTQIIITIMCGQAAEEGGQCRFL